MATLLELSVALQTIQNLAGLQRDMVNNAKIHKSWCLAGTIPVNLILVKITECADAYLVRIKWVTNVTSDATKLTTLTNGLVALGGTVSNANATVTFLKNAVNAMRGAAVAGTTLAEAQAACDTLITTVPEPVEIIQ